MSDFYLKEEVTRGLEREGSTLSGVNAKCYWEELKDNSSSNDASHFNSSSIIQPPRMTDTMRNQNFNKFSILPPIDASSTSKQHYKGDATMDRSSACSSATSEISRTRSCRGVCVRLNIEAASLLPLAFRYVCNFSEAFQNGENGLTNRDSFFVEDA